MLDHTSIYWQQHIDEAIFRMDYLQNINLTEKNVHFSGKPQTLDYTILLGGEYQYIYHISDDTNHDSIFVS